MAPLADLLALVEDGARDAVQRARQRRVAEPANGAFERDIPRLAKGRGIGTRAHAVGAAGRDPHRRTRLRHAPALRQRGNEVMLPERRPPIMPRTHRNGSESGVRTVGTSGRRSFAHRHYEPNRFLQSSGSTQESGNSAENPYDPDGVRAAAKRSATRPTTRDLLSRPHQNLSVKLFDRAIRQRRNECEGPRTLAITPWGLSPQTADPGVSQSGGKSVVGQRSAP